MIRNCQRLVALSLVVKQNFEPFGVYNMTPGWSTRTLFPIKRETKSACAYNKTVANSINQACETCVISKGPGPEYLLLFWKDNSKRKLFVSQRVIWQSNVKPLEPSSWPQADSLISITTQRYLYTKVKVLLDSNERCRRRMATATFQVLE